MLVMMEGTMPAAESLRRNRKNVTYTVSMKYG